MIYLATSSSDEIREEMASGVLGQLCTPTTGNLVVEGASWAADNGCFSDRWDVDRWRKWLERWSNTSGCLFAVVPDVPGDSSATEELWAEHAAFVLGLGYRAAWVAQNGCGSPPPEAGAVFLGGNPECLACGWVRPVTQFEVKECVRCSGALSEWKEGAEARRVSAESVERGLWLHMGRVNSLRRIRIAVGFGCDSADGTFLAIAPATNLPRLKRYLRRVSNETDQLAIPFA